MIAFAQVRLMDALASIRDREEGQGLTEYVFLLVGIVAMVTTIVGVLTGKLQTILSTAINGL
jgi:hypothetical protein